jgi:hypothetical protein
MGQGGAVCNVGISPFKAQDLQPSNQVSHKKKVESIGDLTLSYSLLE